MELINENRLFIWAKPFRIEDLLISEIVKRTDIFKWMRKYDFDRWAIGAFISKKKLQTKSPFTRFEDKNPKKSKFGELLDKGEIAAVKQFITANPGGKNIEVQGPNISLRTSSKGVKSSNYFNDDSKLGKGTIIEESRFTFGEDEIYLFIFKKGSNNENRARQLNGIVYEAIVKKANKLEHPPKGERWDAIGSLDSSYLDSKLNSGAKLLLNGQELVDYNTIPQDFLQPDNNWSIKSCSNGSSSIYFADFKRISGLFLDENGLLRLTDKNLESFILVVGFHTAGSFTEEYIINVKLSNWKKLIPNVSNRNVLLQLQQMYQELEAHRLGSSNKPGERIKDKEESWAEYRRKWSKLTENTDIKLNFKRDTKGQLRIQCSMSKRVFKEKLLKNNDYILIKS